MAADCIRFVGHREFCSSQHALPAGTIHQAESLPGAHSLHLTLSVNQRNTWADFLKVLLPRAVQLAAEEDPDLRRAMPREYMTYMVTFMGVATASALFASPTCYVVLLTA